MYDTLLDARTGIITELRGRPIPQHFPASFALTHAIIGDTRRFSAWPADSSGAGYGFADPDAVRAAAIGEAVERYCGNLVPPGLPVASYTELLADGHDAIDPVDLCLFSDTQYAAPGFPAAPLTRDVRLPWTRGRDVLTGAPVHVPACLVWVSWFGSPVASRAPLTNPVIQAGLAAGPTRDFAVAAALREVIERDAMTLCWTGRLGVRSLRVPGWLADFAQGPSGALQVRWFAFADLFALPVVGALAFDRVTRYLTLGMGVHHDPVDAASKAYAEALQLQLFVADYDDPSSGYGRIAGTAGSPLKAWRADRHYARSYRADLRDVVDYGCHLQLHLDPDVQTRYLLELESATVGELSLDGLPGPVDSTDPAAIAERLAASGHRAVAVDLTTPDVSRAGLHVCRVVVPGLYSNSPFGLPFLGGTRLATAQRVAAVPAPTVPLPH